MIIYNTELKLNSFTVFLLGWSDVKLTHPCFAKGIGHCLYCELWKLFLRLRLVGIKYTLRTDMSFHLHFSLRYTTDIRVENGDML